MYSDFQILTLAAIGLFGGLILSRVGVPYPSRVYTVLMALAIIGLLVLLVQIAGQSGYSPRVIDWFS